MLFLPFPCLPGGMQRQPNLQVRKGKFYDILSITKDNCVCKTDRHSLLKYCRGV